MSEGEVAVSLAGISTPLIIGALAATGATWRFTFVIGALIVALAVAGLLRTEVPRPTYGAPEVAGRSRLRPTLLIVFAIVGLEFALSFWLASYLNASVGLSRNTAVALVSVLYAANLAGRLLASRMARTQSAERVLVGALVLVLLGLPFLLSATGAPIAIVGIVLAGAGIGALFPLTSAIHVQTTGGTADSALGEILSIAALGQMAGPLLAGVIAQAAGLRVGLLVLPAMALLAAAGLAAHQRG
jgi:fucose permease